MSDLSLVNTWNTFCAWLVTNAPTSAADLRVAPSESIESPVGEFGAEPLKTWCRLHDGQWGHAQGLIVGGWWLLSAQRVLNSRTLLSEVTETVLTDILPDGVAGHRTDRFIPTYYPIASHEDGTFLFVDLGSGPQRGCVREWAETDGDLAPRWPSLTHMLRESLNRAAKADGCSVIDGTLTWDW